MVTAAGRKVLQKAIFSFWERIPRRKTGELHKEFSGPGSLSRPQAWKSALFSVSCLWCLTRLASLSPSASLPDERSSHARLRDRKGICRQGDCPTEQGTHRGRRRPARPFLAVPFLTVPSVFQPCSKDRRQDGCSPLPSVYFFPACSQPSSCRASTVFFRRVKRPCSLCAFLS